ncbi:unnamed protein product [Rhizophagus irregularis]|nr:unnamed protein product [Rhizophagus irregularis]
MSIYIMEEGVMLTRSYYVEGLKKRKTTKTTPCCPLNKSVFVGGQLNGKSSQEIKDFISTKFSVGYPMFLKH